MILTKLNNGEQLLVEELAEEFGVSVRTVQRDINERLSYLPIVKENGLYQLEAYCLGKLNFDDIKIFATLGSIKELYILFLCRRVAFFVQNISRFDSVKCEDLLVTYSKGYPPFFYQGTTNFHV